MIDCIHISIRAAHINGAVRNRGEELRKLRPVLFGCTDEMDRGPAFVVQASRLPGLVIVRRVMVGSHDRRQGNPSILPQSQNPVGNRITNSERSVHDRER